MSLITRPDSSCLDEPRRILLRGSPSPPFPPPSPPPKLSPPPSLPPPSLPPPPPPPLSPPPPPRDTDTPPSPRSICCRWLSRLRSALFSSANRSLRSLNQRSRCSNEAAAAHRASSTLPAIFPIRRPASRSIVATCACAARRSERSFAFSRSSRRVWSLASKDNPPCPLPASPPSLSTPPSPQPPPHHRRSHHRRRSCHYPGTRAVAPPPESPRSMSPVPTASAPVNLPSPPHVHPCLPP